MKLKKMYKRALAALMTVMCLLTALPTSAFAASYSSVTAGSYVLVNAASGLVLDVQGSETSSTNKSNVQVYTQLNCNSQIWKISKTSGGWYTLSPASGSTLALNGWGTSLSAGDNINVYTKSTTDSTMGWYFQKLSNGRYVIRLASNTNLVVAESGTSKGSNVALAKYTGATSQQWTLVKSGSYSSKVSAFTSDARWKNGVTWGSTQTPKLSTYSAKGCCAYVCDFAKYVFGVSSYRSGTSFTGVSNIRAGDILHIYNSSYGEHWIVVLSRSGNTLTTAEGNTGDGTVKISSSRYTISGSGLKLNSSLYYTLTTGYHMQ